MVAKKTDAVNEAKAKRDEAKANLELVKSLGLKPIGRSGQTFGANSRGLVHQQTIADAVSKAKQAGKVAMVLPMVGSEEEGWENPDTTPEARKSCHIVQTELSRAQLRTHVKRWVSENPSYRVVNFDPGFLITK